MTTQYTAAFGSPDLPAAVVDAALIRETVEAAGMWLSSYIRGNGTVDVRIDFDATIPTMTGGSFSAAMAGWKMAQDGTHHALATFSTADEILAGTDANGADPDAVITIGLTNLNRWYWFDPTLATAADIPLDRNDGFRIMLHELLHAVGFNGWLANTEDSYAGTAISPFDSLVLRAGGRSWFMGEQAQAAFGGPVR